MLGLQANKRAITYIRAGDRDNFEISQWDKRGRKRWGFETIKMKQIGGMVNVSISHEKIRGK